MAETAMNSSQPPRSVVFNHHQPHHPTESPLYAARRARRPAAAASADTSVSGRAVTLPYAQQGSLALESNPSADFLDECNRRRASGDALVVAVLMGCISISAWKYCTLIPAAAFAHYVAAMALAGLISLGSCLHPTSYTRWREWLVAALRLGLAATPVCDVCMRSIGSHLGDLAPAAGSAFAPLAFLAGLILTSHSLRLALMGLGMPLYFEAHLAVQAAVLALAWGSGDGVCRAILHLDCSGAAAAGTAVAGAGAATRAAAACGTVAAAATTGTERMLAGWHSAFSLLEVWLLPAWLDPRDQPDNPLRQCRCLLAMAQVCLGLLLPVGLHLVWESREYFSHRKRARAQEQHRLQSQPAPAPLYARRCRCCRPHPAVSPAAGSASVAAANGGVGPLRRWVYGLVYVHGGPTPAFIKLWWLFAALALAWAFVDALA